jgi:hypothetical protein
MAYSFCHKMKILLPILCATAIFAATGASAESEVEKQLSETESRFYEAKSKIQSDYRRDLAAVLAKGDRIDVYLLDFETEDTPSDFLFWDTRLEEDEFPIIPYGSKSKILKRSTLSAEQKLEFMPKLQEVVGIQGEIDGGAFCHFPIHGVRVYAGDTIIFQSSFCWKCNNFSVSYPDRPAWVAIRGAGLFEVFSKLMPIPQSELDRFNVKYGPKPEATKEAESGPGE